MSNQQSGGKAAKILYRPFGLVGSISGGLIATAIFKQVWQRAAPGDKPDPPGPLQTEYPLNKILLAAVLQGAIYFLVKTADRSWCGDPVRQVVRGVAGRLTGSGGTRCGRRGVRVR